MSKIKFGPAGIGPTKSAVQVLEEYCGLGFKAAEIAFTYNVYIKDKEDIRLIRESAKKLDIDLSIHAPYFINLNSKEKVKVEMSKKRILKCCEIGEELGATKVVFHPGFYSGMEPEETFQNVKAQVIDMQEILKLKGYKIKLAPEIMGKVNVFGSPEQISRLVKETGCGFTIDFAHILAREKSVDYEKLKKLFPQKNWHCHFSGIEYGEKGEKKHLKTSVSGWRELFRGLPGGKNITIINESPDMINDCAEGLRLFGG